MIRLPRDPRPIFDLPPLSAIRGYTLGVRILVPALLLLSASAAAQPPSDARVRAIVEGAAFKQAGAFIAGDQDRFVRELIQLTEIPAPPFKEQARARAFMDMLRQHGLADVEMDAEGNVMGLRRGSGADAGLLLVNAHLDTVFPEGTDVRVRREGTKLMAPGIGDDTRGLAAMLAVIRAMDAAKIVTRRDVLFVGNVGEEGEGDLRGIKYVLHKGKYKDRVKQAVAIDGSDPADIVRGGVGSRRYRVTFKGPGGHSYGAFGLVNPAYAWHRVTPEQHGDYLVGAYKWAHENWSPWIGVMCLWTLPDPSWGPEREELWWSVGNPDGTDRPALTRLRAARQSGELP